MLLGQELNYIHYNTTNGLNHDVCYSIIERKNGEIWIGTDDDLVRFDGTTFHQINLLDTIGGYIVALEEDEQEQVWISSWKKGIFKYTPATQTLLKSKNQLFKRMSKVCNGIQVNNDKALFFRKQATYTNFWLHHSKKDVTERLLFDENSLAKVTVKLLTTTAQEKNLQALLTPNNNVLLLGAFKGIFEWKDHGVTPFWREEWGALDTISTIEIDNKGTLWLGKRGAIGYSKKNGKWHWQNKNIPLLPITDIYPLNKHKQVIFKAGTSNYQKQTYLYNLKNAALINLDSLLGINSVISDILVDKNNNVWILTDGEGIFVLPDISKYHYTTQTGLNSSFVYTIANHPIDNSLWVTTKKGIHRLNQSKRFFESISDIGYRYSCKQIASYNDVLIAYDWTKSHKAIIANYNQVLPFSQSYLLGVIHPDRFHKNRTWLTSSDTLKLYDDGVLQYSWEFNNDKRYKHIAQISSDSFFISTPHHLLKLRFENGILDYLDTLYFDNAIIHCLHIDQQKKLWVGTQTGLWKMDLEDRVIQKLRIEDGLLSNNITTIVEDNYNRIWIGTSKGLQYKGNDGLWYYYSAQNGLVSSDITSLHIDNQEQLWIGTSRGITVLNLPDLSPSLAPTLSIKTIKVDEQQVAKQTAPFQVYNHQVISIQGEITASLSPKYLIYQYRLNNGQWIDFDRFPLKFTQLSAQGYTLEIRCRKLDSAWGASTNVHFDILLPMYQRTWFLLLIGALILSLVLLAVSFVYRTQQQKQNLEQAIDVAHQKALQTQMNPHFIFNALNSIQNYYINKDFIAANGFLTDFSRLIRNILEDVKETSIVLDRELNNLELYLSLEQMRLGIDRLDFDIEVDAAIDMHKIAIPPMLIQPYVENAIWHGISPLKTKGKVDVIIKKINNNNLQVEILDNGIGLQASQKKNQETALKKNSPIAMNITQERLLLLEKATNKPAAVSVNEIFSPDHQSLGTKVVLIIPIN